MTTRSTKVARPRHVTALVPDPHNANRGTHRGRAALTHSLRTYGAGRAILIDRQGRIIAGNKTAAEARTLGLPLRVVQTDGRHLVAVQRTDLDLATDAHATALAVADNRVGELDLEWDPALLQHLQAEGLDLSPWWTEAELARLFAADEDEEARANTAVAPGPTAIRRGDLFELGRHRLLCGDATSAHDVARLLEDATPVLMVTDPPYGVAYDPAWRHRARPQARTAVGAVLNDDRADWGGPPSRSFPARSPTSGMRP